MNELVSIIIPIYNSEKFLRHSIESILSQTYKNIEVLLIDDGSTDNSLEICNFFHKKDERVRVISIKNQGVSNARNLGIKNSLGKYIMFCDSDDLYHKKYIQIIVRNLELTNSELGVCQYYRFTERSCIKELTVVDSSKQYSNQNEIYNLILFDDEISGYIWNKIFIRDIIVKNKLYFNPLIHEIEDLCFVIDYLKYVKKIIQIEEQLYFYRDNPQSIMNQRFNLKKYSSIYGRLHVYTEIKNSKVNNDIKKNVWIQLIQCCFSYVKQIIFSRTFINKKKYLKEIITIFNSVSQDYRKYSQYNITFKIKLFILIVFSYTSKLLKVGK